MPGRGVLLLISLHAICLVLPVHGECDPSHAVVAVASVLSTLGFVIIVLALAFLIVRWRRRAVRRLDFGEKRDTDGHVNSAFIADDNHLHPTAITPDTLCFWISATVVTPSRP
ncbi:hypothetical protein Btru_073883 [Bulinus truncatus]|nr:hypothetical protein Btru_073883 [Bulinus truncatus]